MTAIFIQLTRDLHVIRLRHFSASFIFEIHDTRQPQPTLRKTKRLRRRGERLVMSRKGPWEGHKRQTKHVSPDISFPPSFARARETSGYEAATTLSRGFSLRKLQGKSLRTSLDTRASDKYLTAVARVRRLCLKSGVRKPHAERRMTLKFRD